MPVPDFQSWFLPLLRLEDGKEHEVADLYEQLADDLALPPQDRATLLKSGKQYVYENRIGWARTYLKKAGLVESPSRGVVRITERGRDALSKKLDKLTIKLVEDPQERDMLARVREMKARGLSTARVASILNAEGPLCRGGRWHVTTIARALRRAA